MNLPHIETLRRELSLPPLLRSLIAAGRWKHPGARALRRVAPFITDPLAVLKTFDHMLVESGPLMADGAVEDDAFSEYRGSQVAERDLPWIDVEKTLFIFCNERPGDDVGIALDYRRDPAAPRVVGGDWHSEKRLIYRLVANSFDDFAEAIGLSSR